MNSPVSQHPTLIVEKQPVTVAQSTLAATATNQQLVAANPDRRRLIVRNTGTTNLGLSTNAASTYAQCPITLAPGEMWVESLAAGVEWRAIMESGTATIPYQTATD